MNRIVCCRDNTLLRVKIVQFSQSEMHLCQNWVHIGLVSFLRRVFNKCRNRRSLPAICLYQEDKMR